MLAHTDGFDEGGRALVDRIVVQVNVLDVVAFGHRSGELGRGHDAALEQGLTGCAAALAGLDDGTLDRLAGRELVGRR